MRKFWWIVFSTLVLVGALSLGGGCGLKTAESPVPSVKAPGAESPKDAPPRIAQLMFVLDKGARPINGNLRKALKKDDPDWEAVQGLTKELTELAADLAKNDTPPKGSKEAWQKQTAAFSEAADALHRAAQAKDLPAARSADELLNSTCMKCHKEHKRSSKG